MALDALMNPRGPLPPGVYWRRRVVLAAAVVLLFALLLRSCGGGDARLGQTQPSPSASPSSTPSASPSASPRPSVTASPTPTRVPGEPCRRGELKVEAVTDAKTYAPTARPKLTIKVTNTGPVACTRDLGSAATELRVLSGNDRVWSSDDCTNKGEPDIVTLPPRGSESATVTWARRRSSPGCDGERPAVPPGTYRLVARAGDVTSAPVSFVLQ